MRRALFVLAIIAGIALEAPIAAVIAYVSATEILRASMALFGNSDVGAHVSTFVKPGAHLTDDRGGCREAIAIRDFVPPEQRAGTKFFTERFLFDGTYDRATYIEAGRFDEGATELAQTAGLARDAGCSVDLFVLELGGDYTALAPLERYGHLPLFHLVYDTGGGGARYARRWREMGAEAFVGHNGPNLAPIFYVSFLPRYVSGEKLDDAVRHANDDMRTVVDAIAPFLEIAGEHDVARLESDTDAHVFRNVRER